MKNTSKHLKIAYDLHYLLPMIIKHIFLEGISIDQQVSTKLIISSKIINDQPINNFLSLLWSSKLNIVWYITSVAQVIVINLLYTIGTIITDIYLFVIKVNTLI